MIDTSGAVKIWYSFPKTLNFLSLLLVAFLLVSLPNRGFTKDDDTKGRETCASSLLGGFDLLPPKDSAAWSRLLTKLRSDLNSVTGSGFSVLETTEFFPADLGKRLAEEFPAPLIVFVKYQKRAPLAGWLTDKISAENREALEQFFSWAFDLVSHATGGSFFRREETVISIGNESETATDWHKDPDFYTVILSLGVESERVECTEIIDGSQKVIQLLPRQLAVLSGQQRENLYCQRVKGTIHRGPQNPNPRIFIRSQLRALDVQTL